MASGGNHQAKADELFAKAEKKLKSWGVFGNKHEEAVELLDKAANNYKLAKSWAQAGETYEKLTECHLKLDSMHEAASAYVDAASAYKKVNTEDAIRCLNKAVEYFTEMGRLGMAAKNLRDIGEILEKEERYEEAIDKYEGAAELYSGEDSQSHSSQCKLKVAQYSAQLSRYARAIELYEEVARASLDNNLLRYSAKNYLLCAGICHLATGDTVAIRNALEKYVEWDPSFQNTREQKLLNDLADALENVDTQKFGTAVYEYDSMSQLDPWKTTMLLRTKKLMEGMEAGGADDLT
eukprot:jgi/Mesvir1/21406/Mv20883-RA.1